MLPASYATPAAAIIAFGGLLACFAGYRLFRFVLGIYGFLVGAFLSTNIAGAAADMWTLAIAAVVGGVVGAVLMVAAYFIGVGLVGAGLAAVAINVGWRLFGGEPPTWVLVVGCVLGALGALSLVRWVVIVGTATAGSWTLIVGALALMGDPQALTAAAAGDVWVFYPLAPIPDRWWYTVLWVGLIVVGVVVQAATTSKMGKRKSGRSKAAA
jgi:hypothetical protein